MESIFKIIIYLIITIGLLSLSALGIYLIIYSNNLTASGYAKVIDVSCTGNNNCNSMIQFISNNQQYTATIPGNYTVGQDIQINYDPNYLTEIVSPATIKIIIGLLLIISSIIALKYMYKMIYYVI